MDHAWWVAGWSLHVGWGIMGRMGFCDALPLAGNVLVAGGTKQLPESAVLCMLYE